MIDAHSHQLSDRHLTLPYGLVAFVQVLPAGGIFSLARASILEATSRRPLDGTCFGALARRLARRPHIASSHRLPAGDK